jgi:small-conductance mechanosensitive channel
VEGPRSPLLRSQSHSIGNETATFWSLSAAFLVAAIAARVEPLIQSCSMVHGLKRSLEIAVAAATFALLLAVRTDTATAQNSQAQGTTSSQIIQFLGQNIQWYRQTQQEQHIVSEPADLGFLADNRRLAGQVVKLAFDFARQEAQRRAQAKQQSSPEANPSSSNYESLNRAAAGADQLVQQTQAELEALKQKAETAPASKRRQMQTQIAELESELGLFQARQQALHGMLDFASGASSGGGKGGLRAQIDELAAAVPAAVSGANISESTSASDQQQTAKADQALTKPSPTGIWSITAELFRLSSKRNFLSNEIGATQQLQDGAAKLRAPLVGQLKQLLQTGDQLAKQADTSDQKALEQEKQQIDALTAEFKQVSTLLASLSKQGILLDLYKNNLASWQAEIASEFKEQLRGLLARLVGLAIALGVVFLIGELWRRAIFRYVHDLRRRYQFLLMRRIALWCGVALVLIFAFVTELGAVATFAGLITAGVAVALQNVIVSIVGYFFLIGKFGIRVGDRVQVGGVNGEVVDIGLVRFHLMELTGDVGDAEPSGRVVAFSNSVVFQSTAGLFKQIPGTNFIWHEIVLKFSSDSDYRTIRDRVQKAIESAYADYRDKLEAQRRQMELTLTSVSASELKPTVRTHFTTSTIEVSVRYPVVIDKASDIDERVLGEIFAAIDREPKLILLDSKIPAHAAGAQV